ncbi:MAG: SMC family ATPase [Hydrogenimonas sp.]|nr:MAG: SMC family ATPase [Hydrogenimonas sp.]
MMRFMMTLESLKLKNFKRYREFEIAFEEGLYGILGRNGSGKSTIFEAIFFALYGEYKGSKDLVKTANAEGNVSVELTFLIEDRRYRVIREFRGKALTAYATLKEGDETIATSAKEVTATITKLLGMGKEAFLHTVFASQKELTALSTMKNDARKTMMRRLLGLEKIDAIEEMIRESLRDLNRDIKSAATYLLSDEAVQAYRDELKQKCENLEKLAREIERLKGDEKERKRAYEDAKREVEAQQKAKEARQKKVAEYEQVLQRLKLREKQLETLNSELAELQKRETHYREQRSLIEKFKQMEKTLAQQEELKAKFLKKEGLEREQEQLRSEYKSRKGELKGLQQEIAPLKGLQERLKAEQSTLEQLKVQFQQLDQQINTLNATIVTNHSKIEDVKKRLKTLKELGSESPCPVCTRPLLDQYEAVLASLNHEINAIYQKEIDTAQTALNGCMMQKEVLEKRISETEAQVSETDRQIARLQSKVEEIKKVTERLDEVAQKGQANNEEIAKLGNVTYDEAKHNALKEEREALKPEVDALLKLEALIATIPAKIEEQKSLQAQMTTDKASLTEHQKRIDEDGYSEEVHAKAVETLKACEKEKDEIVVRLNGVTLEHANVQRDIEAIEKELKRDEANREALKAKEHERDDYEKLKAVMREFKTHINARIAPRIGEVASEMYSRITRGKYQHIEVSPEFDFFIYENGEKYPIERFSGGEIDLANLVLRIAISKTLSELSGAGNIGFLAFDEVFGSQDEERRIRIMEAFHTISESYRQIFLISHETEIKEMFERVVEL